MTRLIRTLAILSLLCAGALAVAADQELEFDPITPADWDAAPPADCPVQDAVMIFERIIADDTKISNGIQHYTLYRRIRILGASGRDHANGTVPVQTKDHQVKAFKARTVLRNGREFHLEKRDLKRAEVLRTKKLKFEQETFLLPAVDDDCIIEYAMRIRIYNNSLLPRPPAWIVQKEMMMLHGSYLWHFDDSARPIRLEDNSKSKLTPQYVLRNCADWVEVELRPSPSAPTELWLTAENVPPLEVEPFSYPFDSISAQGHLYYSNDYSTMLHWLHLQHIISSSTDEFMGKTKRLARVVEELPRDADRDRQTRIAIDWIRDNIRRVEERTSRSRSKTRCDDVIKHGRGTPQERHMILAEMLSRLNIPARLAFGLPRDEQIFLRDVKGWQFTTPLIVLLDRDTSNPNRFYTLACDTSPCGCVPWRFEGTTAFIISKADESFHTIPLSSAESNTHRRVLDISVDEQLHCRGHCEDLVTGHEELELRDALRILAQSTPDADRLAKSVRRDLNAVAIDSLRIERAENQPPLLATRAALDLGIRGELSGSRMMVRRLGDEISLQRRLCLKNAILPKSSYPDLRALCTQFDRLSDATVVLRKRRPRR
jgi:hypothetical protein